MNVKDEMDAKIQTMYLNQSDMLHWSVPQCHQRSDSCNAGSRDTTCTFKVLEPRATIKTELVLATTSSKVFGVGHTHACTHACTHTTNTFLQLTLHVIS